MNLIRASVFFCFAIAGLATDALGQTNSSWTGGAGDGQWTSAGNWSPNGQPLSPNDVFITTPTTIALPTTSIGSLFIQSSTVNLSASNNTFTASVINVDNGATLNLDIASGGAVISTNSVTPIASTFIGDGGGSGTLNLTDAGSLNFTSSTLGSGVGIGGTGIFNQSGSTTVNVTTGSQNGFFVVGADGNVSTPSSLPPNSQIANGGIGTYTISQSATLNADTFAIGLGSGTGSGNGTGGATATTGVLNINGGSVNVTTMILGSNNTAPTNAVANVSGTIIQTAGVATISNLLVGVSTGAVANYALSGGTLAVNTDLNLGGTGATGTMTQSGGSTLNATGTFDIGTDGGAGIFNYNGGTLNATNGITVGATGIFNQGTNFTPTLASNPITLDGGTYSLNAGTLSIGGNTGTGTSGVSGTGSFNFAGGTAVITSAWTDTLNSTISGTSIIDTTVAGATLSGILTGGGTFDIIGGNTVNLTGASNTGSWGATLTGGSTLTAASVNSLSANGSYIIGSGSTFNLSSSGAATDTFNGSISDMADISGMATFNVNIGANKLVLAGPTNLSINSATNIIGGGTLEVDNGTISNVTGTNGTDTFDVGNGTSSTGTVMLLGANVLPVVTVNTGSTLLAGNSIPGNMAITGNVINNGTLGTLGSLNAPATLLISGNLTSTGTLIVNSNGQTIDTFGSAASPLASANLSGIVKVASVGSVTNVPIVYTTGGVTATIGTAPGDLTTSAPTALYTSTIAVVNNDLVLTTTQGLTSGFAQTPNQASVGRTLDQVIVNGLPFSPGFVKVLTVLNQLSASALPGALEQLTPESLQYSRNIAFENSTLLAERMNGVDADLHGGLGGLDTNAISIVAPGFDSGLGRSLGSLLAYNDPPYHDVYGTVGANFYPEDGSSDSSPPSTSSRKSRNSSNQHISDSTNTSPDAVYRSGPELPTMNEFIGGDVILADLNQNQNTANAPSSKASYTAGDATAGISFRMTSHLAAGVLFDYNHTDAKTDSSGSKTTVDSYSPGLFATYFDHGFYANGLFSFGYNNYSNTRNVSFLGETASSHPTGQQYVGDLDLGYDFHPNKSWIVGPTLGLTYTHLDIASFNETGAPGADLNVQDQSVDSLRSRFGGHVVYQVYTNQVLLQPNLTAMWQHEFLGDESGITSSFNDFSASPFTIQAAQPSRDSALVGLGLTATLNNSMALYLNYLADVGASDYFAQSVIGGFKARF